MSTDDITDTEGRITITGSSTYGGYDTSLSPSRDVVNDRFSLKIGNEEDLDPIASTERLFGITPSEDDDLSLVYHPPTDDKSTAGSLSPASNLNLRREFTPLTKGPFMVGAEGQVVPGMFGKLRDISLDSPLSPGFTSPPVVVTPTSTAITTSDTTIEPISPPGSPPVSVVFTPPATETPGTPPTPYSPLGVSPEGTPVVKTSKTVEEQTNYFEPREAPT
jgi:hypothetical protein